MIETRVTAIIATGSAFSERRRLADNHHHRPDQPLGCVRLSRRQGCTNSMAVRFRQRVVSYVCRRSDTSACADGLRQLCMAIPTV
jgi:hypothetical protein